MELFLRKGVDINACAVFIGEEAPVYLVRDSVLLERSRKGYII
jgi:hypothetical protein